MGAVKEKKNGQLSALSQGKENLRVTLPWFRNRELESDR